MPLPAVPAVTGPGRVFAVDKPIATTLIPAEAVGEDAGERPDLLVDDHFAVVPEWVLDSEISDCAVRLYAVLLRYGQTSGARMPSRATLARRLRKGSTDTVDRAMKELAALGAVSVERRQSVGISQTNRYYVRTRRPDGGGRIHAAPTIASAAPRCQPMPGAAEQTAADPAGGRMEAAQGRKSAAGGAAKMRPNPEFFTQRKPTPPDPPHDQAGSGDRLHELEAERCDDLAHQLGLSDGRALEALAAELVALRAERGMPVASWSTRGLIAALQLSVQRGRPVDRAVVVLRVVAADPATRSPMRLAEGGPWWDPPVVPGLRRTRQEADELEQLELALGERNDRAWLQSRARADLLTSGQTVDRLSVARRAIRLAEQTSLQQASRGQRQQAC